MDLIYTSLFFALLIAWAWVSIILFRIYSEGTEIVFSVRYRATGRGSTAEMRRQFMSYLIMLWAIEIITGFSTFTILALWVQTL